MTKLLYNRTRGEGQWQISYMGRACACTSWRRYVVSTALERLLYEMKKEDPRVLLMSYEIQYICKWERKWKREKTDPKSKNAVIKSGVNLSRYGYYIYPVIRTHIVCVCMCLKIESQPFSSSQFSIIFQPYGDSVDCTSTFWRLHTWQ